MPNVSINKHVCNKKIFSDLLAIENDINKNNTNGQTGNTMLESFLFKKRINQFYRIPKQKIKLKYLQQQLTQIFLCHPLISCVGCQIWKQQNRPYQLKQVKNEAEHQILESKALKKN